MAVSRTNRLINESSPYLLQHAHNPVDWFPWGAEALEEARRQDKPILLSIGYSACHWCHVMERESFESEETAALMNRLFVNIKVDREERPDIDAIYMDYVQMTAGSGGWPLTVFLTPDQVPFFGGTYFPPVSTQGRPGFPDLLEAVARAYRDRRAEIETQADSVRAALAQSSRVQAGEANIDDAILDDAFQSLARQFDNNHGGFGGAPKFPSTMALGFLLRYHRRTASARALEMVELSLQEMARGGIYDQLGGGFHRYSVDASWLVPHFEKMLYDNALLARLYSAAYQATGNSFYRTVLQETLDYVTTSLLHPEGGFFSAEDADSEGEEGKYYVWSRAEIGEILGEEDARIFSDYFDVSEAGNFEGHNILHHRQELRALARRLDIAPDELAGRLDACRQKLLAARELRVKPGLDDKILCAWNGMMLSAFAEAAFALNHDGYLEIATRNAEFITSQLWREGRLHRTWKNGTARLNGYLDDYALTIEGLLALYEACGDSRWLLKADELMQAQIAGFSDPDSNDFYYTSRDHESLLVKQKEYLDNATPSGNSTSCLNLVRLAELLGKEEYRNRAAGILRKMGRTPGVYALGLGYWLQALDYYLGPIDEIAIVGEARAREPLLAVLRAHYLPNKVVAVGTEKEGRTVPLLADRKTAGGKAAAYVCRNYTCLKPVTSPEELEEAIRGTAGVGRD